jgi:hypothetical protein
MARVPTPADDRAVQSNVSGLTVEWQHDRVQLAVDGHGRKGVGDQAVRREAGRGSLGLSKPATHRTKAVGSVSGFALSKGGLTTPTTQAPAIARLPLSPPNREGYRLRVCSHLVREATSRGKRNVSSSSRKSLNLAFCQKAEEASLRWTRQRLVQLMLEICNLDLITLPSPAHLPPSLTPSTHFASFLAGAGVISVWSHMPADCVRCVCSSRPGTHDTT